MPGRKGSAYMKFIIEKLKPYIDKTYRTNPFRSYTFVGGSSLGGISAFMIAWEYPTLFSKAICMSSAFKYQNDKGKIVVDYVKRVRASEQPKESLFFYIDNGGDAIDSELQPGIDEMLKELQQKGFQADRDYVWVHDKNAKHFEADWARRFPEAIRSLFIPK
ncbi:MAG: alpha/beta hydrolase [Fidelibacterota bacterium]